MSRLLIVDDEVVMITQIEAHLKKAGYEIVGAATDGAQAVQLAIKTRPDLVIMDIMLSGEFNGIKAAKIISESTGIPIIFLTAHSENSYIQKVKEVNPYGYILKPLVEPELLVSIEIALYKAEMDRKLQASEEQYRSLTENLNIGIYQMTVELRGKILAANPAFVEIFGYNSKEELLKRPVTDFYQDAKNRKTLIRKLQQNGFVKNEEVALKKKDGTTFLGSLSISIVNDENGKAMHLDGVVEDITERKQLEEQLRQAQKMDAIGQLAGGVAHDFNNMLGGIMGFAELALKHVSNPKYVGDYLKNIIRKCDASSQLVQQLLAFSRKQVLDIQPLNLNSVINGSLKFLQRVIGENIIITQDLDSEIALIHADLTTLDQLITNICLNSRDAMPDGGNLLIRTSNVTIDADYCRQKTEATPGTYVRLMITDNGTGMDKTTLEGIFEPFFTTKETEKGTGLGLSMVYGLIKQHNGFIECKSELGRGTSIKLYFPAQYDTIGKIKPDRILLAPSGSETLLLVEDEEDLLLIIQTILAEYGYTVLTAENGIEALKQYQAHQSEIQLIISDVVMPEMGGVNLYKNIHVKDSKIKFLFITGYTLDETFNKYIDWDGLDLLQKPFRKEEIARKVRDILDR
ncbi:MAG: response regulator [Candidatus Marinimicrobia bacterium]|nr:response regulator [Candidatus Neomarinimicrobiota bacterium]